ncbi:hypothetical protein AMJ57_01405 [Parcubacteria bacterium SG8_24]|nr:MAG: hypothetical protein AMJ57_01405 [Parcubacteria bacterium SG8_24]
MTGNGFSTTRFLLLGAALGVVFFFLYSFLPLTAPPRFNSPDEMSNHFFAVKFLETQRLWHLEPLNLEFGGEIGPRSMRSVDGFLVPGGFLGLPLLYGSLGMVGGRGLLLFLTPIFAVLGALFWGLLIRRLFGDAVGLAAMLLLMAHPVWWYEASRTMMPNVLFMTLTIAAAYFLFAEPLRGFFCRRPDLEPRLLHHGDAIISGLLAALALFVRTSEAYWLALAGIVLLATVRPLPWRRILIFLASALFMMLPLLIFNHAVYGNIFASGYGDALQAVPPDQVAQGRGAQLLGPLRPYLFPLGFAPRDAWRHFLSYGVAFFSWWSVLTAVAVLLAGAVALRRRGAAGRPTRPFVLVALTVSLWLILFYGSWTIRDNPDPDAVTIGSSYFRYWLPLFLFSTVPVAWMAARLVGRVPRKQMPAVATVLFLAYAAFSGQAVFGSPDEGLTAIRQTLEQDHQTALAITDLTEVGSLIVVDRADKTLFPDRAVLQPLRDERTYRIIGETAHRIPVYYFGITFPERDLSYLHEVKLKPWDLMLEPIEGFGERTLYRIKPSVAASAD